MGNSRIVMQKKSSQYWQWRTIILLMIGYAMYYFVRKNLSVAIPAMETELGLTKAQLGIFLTINGVIYGFSRYLNGIIADRVSQKRLMALGLFLSALINLFICFSPQLDGVFHLLNEEGKATLGLTWLIGSLWVVNGYIQGMGVPPCVSLLAHWIRPSLFWLFCLESVFSCSGAYRTSWGANDIVRTEGFSI